MLVRGEFNLVGEEMKMPSFVLSMGGAIYIAMPAIVCAEEISFVNYDGDAVAYVDVGDDLTIYLWSGEPVAYFSMENIFGFNGHLLGWFVNGAIFDHSGDAVCATREAFSGITSLELLKSLKKLKPLKSLKELEPLRPLFSQSFGATPCSIALATGRK